MVYVYSHFLAVHTTVFGQQLAVPQIQYWSLKVTGAVVLNPIGNRCPIFVSHMFFFPELLFVPSDPQRQTG